MDCFSTPSLSPSDAALMICFKEQDAASLRKEIFIIHLFTLPFKLYVYLDIKISETLIKPPRCTKVQQSNLWIEEKSKQLILLIYCKECSIEIHLKI